MINTYACLHDLIIDDSITLKIDVSCSTLEQRKEIQKRFRLRNRISKSIAETMGLRHFSQIEIDSQMFDIDFKNISCIIVLSIYQLGNSKLINAKTILMNGIQNGDLSKVCAFC